MDIEDKTVLLLLILCHSEFYSDNANWVKVLLYKEYLTIKKTSIRVVILNNSKLIYNELKIVYVTKSDTNQSCQLK